MSSFLPRVPPRAASVACMLCAPAVYKSVAAKICSRACLAVRSLCYRPGCFLKGRVGPRSGGSVPELGPCRGAPSAAPALLVPAVHRAASPPGLLRLSSPGVFASMSHNKGFPKETLVVVMPYSQPPAALLSPASAAAVLTVLAHSGFALLSTKWHNGFPAVVFR